MGTKAPTPPGGVDSSGDARVTPLAGGWVRDFTARDTDFTGSAAGDDRGYVSNQLGAVVSGNGGVPVWVGRAGHPSLTTTSRHSFDAWWSDDAPKVPAKLSWGWSEDTSTLSWTSSGYWPIVSTHSPGLLTGPALHGNLCSQPEPAPLLLHHRLHQQLSW